METRDPVRPTIATTADARGEATATTTSTTTPNSVIQTMPLGFPWPTVDPFLFCAYHNDAYPRGNGRMGPAVPLDGRPLGHDFEPKDGWRMYHGQAVPGFPQHPHCGFETVTIVRRGHVDHSDSLGATARYGPGDVQWLTTGRGVVHSEMFPLLQDDADNPLELFQIWLNLPRATKEAEPRFEMFWRDAVPTVTRKDADGRRVRVTLIAGALDDVHAPTPPPASWAADPASDLAIWTLAFEPDAETTLPAARPGTSRVFYVFGAGGVEVDGRIVVPQTAVQLRADAAVRLRNPSEAHADVLLLQGRPIGEPVVQHGPFVASSRADLLRAFDAYRQSGFGGWPWGADDPVHPKEEGRFARLPDGRIDKPRP